MLVLTRFPGEQIFLRVPPSDHERVLTLTAISTDRTKMRIGLEADRDITIWRDDAVKHNGKAQDPAVA